MKILIYDDKFHAITGTVKYILPIADILSQKHEVTLLGDNNFTKQGFEKYYDMGLKNITCEYLSTRYSTNNCPANK